LLWKEYYDDAELPITFYYTNEEGRAKPVEPESVPRCVVGALSDVRKGNSLCFDVDSIGLTNVVDYLNRGFDIGEKKLESPTGFLIGVGANPGTINLDYEISRFEWKVDAGAEFAITQPVFDIRILEEFLKRIEHCRIPILAGIWPLYSLRNAEFMHNEVPGASIPEDIMNRINDAQEIGAEQARKEGVAIAQEIIREIRTMVQGFQISPPLGKYELALEVLKAL